MARAFSFKGSPSFASATDASSYATAVNVSFGANNLALVAVMNSRAGGATLPTLSGAGLGSFTQIDTTTFSTSRITWFRAQSATPGAAAPLVADFGGVTQLCGEMLIYEVTGHIATSGGADAIGDTDATTGNDNSAEAAITTANLRSGIVAAVYTHLNETISDAEAGWTVDFNVGHASPSRRVAAISRLDLDDTTLAATWTTAATWGALALEIKWAPATLSSGPVVSEVIAGATATATIGCRISDVGALKLRYGTASDLTGATTTAAMTTAAASDFTGARTVASLTANTRYYYTWLLDDVELIPAPYPNFKTPLVPGSATSFKFAVLSDLERDQNDAGAEDTFQAVAAEGVDFVVILGDWDHRNPATLTAKRTMHRDLSGANPVGVAFRDNLLESLSVFRTWDDHDSDAGGDTNRHSAGIADGTARQAFTEYNPGTYPAGGIYRSMQWGCADIFALDVRSFRDDPATDPSPLVHLGATQLQWLKDGLAASTASWQFIMTGVAFNPGTKPTDSWGAFPDERADLVANINAGTHAETLIILSGDLHSGGAIDSGVNSDYPEASNPHTNLVDGDSGTPGTWSEGYTTGVGFVGGYTLVTVSPSLMRLETKTNAGAVTHTLELAVETPVAGTDAPAVGLSDAGVYAVAINAYGG